MLTIHKLMCIFTVTCMGVCIVFLYHLVRHANKLTASSQLKWSPIYMECKKRGMILFVIKSLNSRTSSSWTKLYERRTLETVLMTCTHSWKHIKPVLSVTNSVWLINATNSKFSQFKIYFSPLRCIKRNLFVNFDVSEIHSFLIVSSSSLNEVAALCIRQSM